MPTCFMCARFTIYRGSRLALIENKDGPGPYGAKGMGGRDRFVGRRWATRLSRTGLRIRASPYTVADLAGVDGLSMGKRLQ